MKNLRPAKILVVDDEERNIKLLEILLHAEGYSTLTAYNGRDALRLAETELPDLILLDIMMPEMDGFATVAQLKTNSETHPIPVVMLTALDDRAAKIRALEAGAEEFLSKPIDRVDLIIRVRNLLRLKEYGDFLTDHNRILTEQVESRTAQLKEAYRDTVFTLVRAAEHKDEETGRHVRRISYYCKLLAEAMGLPTEFHDAIFQASPMHDIGKIGIPDHVLLKPGGFSDEEWSIMRTHCALGASILSSGSSPYTGMGAQIAQNHHERWDGSGYPNGLKGEAIPIAARLMQICDVYDALRSHRPYKEAYSHERAVEIIAHGDGRTEPQHFDPAVLACFLKQEQEFNMIFQRYRDE